MFNVYVPSVVASESIILFGILRHGSPSVVIGMSSRNFLLILDVVLECSVRTWMWSWSPCWLLIAGRSLAESVSSFEVRDSVVLLDIIRSWLLFDLLWSCCKVQYSWKLTLYRPKTNFKVVAAVLAKFISTCVFWSNLFVFHFSRRFVSSACFPIDEAPRGLPTLQNIAPSLQSVQVSHSCFWLSARPETRH